MHGKQAFCKKSICSFGFLIAILFLFGCTQTTEVTESDQPLKIGLMITPHGLNDKGFNDYALDGLQAAEKKYNIQGILIEPSTMQDPQASLRFFAGQDFDAIIVVGIAFVDAIREISAEHDSLPFFVIDSDIDEENIYGITFREEEGSFLCGYLAAVKSDSNRAGFIGGVEIPVIQRFEAGFRQGAAFAQKETEVVVKYLAEDFSGFNLPEKAEQVAFSMYSDEVDVIFAAAGASGLGAISAAAQSGNYVIGVDMNQDSLAPGLVLTSMLKRVDLVVEMIAENISKNKSAAEVQRSFGLSEGAIGLTDFQLSSKAVGQDLILRLNSLKQKIIKGEIDLVDK